MQLLMQLRKAARAGYGVGWAMIVLLVASCAGQSVSQAINAYEAEAGRIELGQSKAEVLAILEPTQRELATSQSRKPDRFLLDGKRREVYFFRTSSFSDGLVTDDEFTPYVFDDDVLVAIGWTAIGGPKTQAQTRDSDTGFYFHYGRIHY